MAKKREVTINRFALNDTGCELKGKVKFNLSLFNGDPAPQDHVVSFDLSMTRAKAIDLIISSIVITIQGIMRKLGSHAKARNWADHELTMADIFPDRREREPESPERAAAKALGYAENDAELRKAMIAELMAMEAKASGK